VNSGLRSGATGRRYYIVWTGFSSASVILAEKAVEDAWRTAVPAVRIGSIYPDDSPAGERVRMVAGLTEIPLVELTLKLEEKAPEKPALPSPAKPKPQTARHTGRIAIIIDDIGNDIAALDQLMALPVTITYSVLPYSLHVQEACQKLEAAGAPVMLHMPMQPLNYPEEDPGPGALLLTMTAPEIQKSLADALAMVPLATGVNNHMGSAFTIDRDRMSVFLDAIKLKGLFFVDSRTTDRTIGFALARQMGIKSAERKVFLDNREDLSAILSQVRLLARESEKQGSAIAIGHPYPETIQALTQALPGLKESGYEFVPARELIQ
jgi:hypothetical protein